MRRILRGRATLPNLGRELEGRWVGHRALLALWHWMLLVDRIDDDHDRVVVLTVQDARSSSAAAASDR